MVTVCWNVTFCWLSKFDAAFAPRVFHRVNVVMVQRLPFSYALGSVFWSCRRGLPWWSRCQCYSNKFSRQWFGLAIAPWTAVQWMICVLDDFANMLRALFYGRSEFSVDLPLNLRLRHSSLLKLMMEHLPIQHACD